jgi:serine/threonine-protein phosphatase 6 regulatory subunit 3
VNYQTLSELQVTMLVFLYDMSSRPLLIIWQDNDTFGPFSDSAAASGSDPFTFRSSFTEDDSAFDTFGDFGDFQSAQDGELTPTAGSWTFTSGSSASDEWSEGSGHTEEHEMDKSGGNRTTDGALS